MLVSSWLTVSWQLVICWWTVGVLSHLGLAAPAPRFLGTQPPYATQALTNNDTCKWTLSTTDSFERLSSSRCLHLCKIQLSPAWIQLSPDWTTTRCQFWESWLALVSKGQKMTKDDRGNIQDTHLNNVKPLSHCVVSRQLEVGGDKDSPAVTNLSRAVAISLTASWIWDDSLSWSNCIPMAPEWQSMFIIKYCTGHNHSAIRVKISIHAQQKWTRFLLISILIGQVEYIIILAWLWGFQDTFLHLVVFSQYSSLFGNWETKEMWKIYNYFFPESLTPMLEYWYIEHGLVTHYYND